MSVIDNILQGYYYRSYIFSWRKNTLGRVYRLKQ